MRAKIRESAVRYLLNYMRVFVFMVLMGVCQYYQHDRNELHTIMVDVFGYFQFNVLLFPIKNTHSKYLPEHLAW